MSAASSLTARIMETWAHGQDVADALGVEREPDGPAAARRAPRGRARAYSFVAHGRPVPDGADPGRARRARRRHVGLGARRRRRPGRRGPRWTSAWSSPSAATSTTRRCGSSGPVADRVDDFAQAFAGPPARAGRHAGVARDTTRPVRIANCSGFYGDRLAAAREMVEGGPIDVLTGDYLAELTMLILEGAGEGPRRRLRAHVPHARWRRCSAPASTAASRSSPTPAGSTRPGSPTRSTLGERLGLRPRSRYVEGDDLPTGSDLLARRSLAHLDTGSRSRRRRHAGDGQRLPRRLGHRRGARRPAPTSSSAGGSPTRRSSSARPRGGTAGRATTGTRSPARSSPGTSSSAARRPRGGNYAFLDEIADRRYPGFPIAEVAADGSSRDHQAPGHRRAGLGRHGHRAAALRDRRARVRQPGRRRALRHHRADARTARDRVADHRRAGQPAAGHAQGRAQLRRRLPQHDDVRAHRPRHRGQGRAGRGAAVRRARRPRAVRRGRRAAAAVRPARRADRTSRPPRSCGSP